MEILEYTWTEKLRLANRNDFIIKLRGEEQLIYGAIFFLQSMQTAKIEGPYLFDKGRNMTDFKEWLENNMVYVRDNS